MEEIKPCPNCKASGAKVFRVSLVYKVMCDICGVTGPYSAFEDGAIKNWNKLCAKLDTTEIITDVATIMNFILSTNLQSFPTTMRNRMYAMQLDEAMNYAKNGIDSLILRNETSDEKLTASISSYVVAIGKLLQEA